MPACSSPSRNPACDDEIPATVFCLYFSLEPRKDQVSSSTQLLYISTFVFRPRLYTFLLYFMRKRLEFSLKLLAYTRTGCATVRKCPSTLGSLPVLPVECALLCPTGRTSRIRICLSQLARLRNVLNEWRGVITDLLAIFPVNMTLPAVTRMLSHAGKRALPENSTTVAYDHCPKH